MNYKHKEKSFILSMFLSERERYEMSKTKKFKNTNAVWNRGQFNYVQRIGALSAIAQNANRSWKKNGGIGIMPKRYFVDYYLYTGDIRRKFMSKDDNLLKSKSEYGRTMPELYRLANNFRSYTKFHGNIVLSEKEAFNYVIIRVFDKTYEGFLREENTIVAISESLGNKYLFEAADSCHDIYYSVDYIGFDKNRKIVSAIQIKPLAYYYSKKGSVYKNINIKKHNKFFKKYGIYPVVVYSDIDGSMLNSSEVLQRLQKNNKTKRGSVL